MAIRVSDNSNRHRLDTECILGRLLCIRDETLQILREWTTSSAPKDATLHG